MGITEHLFFDGVDLNDFGALPIIGNIYASAERVYETVSVPGRSGDLLLDGGRYANVTRTYDVIFAGPAVRAQAAALGERAELSFWENVDADRVVMRICTSWATTPEDVDGLIACL